jgi:hypothetical protein
VGLIVEELEGGWERAFFWQAAEGGHGRIRTYDLFGQ